MVTPCLNATAWLPRCLDSVAAQGYGRIEHLVVDGGSTDGSLELLRSRPVRLVSEVDAGQSDAINKGFALARGELLTWLNADDELAPGAVESVVDAARRLPGCGWFYGDVLIREGSRSGIRHAPASLGPHSFEFGNAIAQPGCFFRRSALATVGSLDSSLDLAMDFDLWVRLSVAGVRAARVAGPLATFHVEPGSKTSRATPRDWAREEATVLAKAGLPRAAAAACGRWAVAAAGGSRGPWSTARDAARLGREWAREDLEVPSPLAVSAGAVAAALLDGRTRSRGAYVLALRPEPWLVAETRRVVGGELRATIGRRLARAG